MIEDIVNNFLEQGKVFETKSNSIREGFDTEIIKREQEQLNENKQAYSTSVVERNKLQKKYSNLEKDYSVSNNKLQDKTKMLINRTSPSNPYLNKNITLTGAAGTLPVAGVGFGGYVTSQGVFKSYPNQKTKDNIVGKNGCPLDNVQGVQNNQFSSSLIQGSDMAAGQACGYEGQNVYVSSLIDKPTATYKGCYFNTDDNKNIAMEQVNGITDFESCKTYAASNGYQLFGTTDLQANGLSQYDNLDHWLPMGFTSGSVSFEPERDTRYEIREWLKKNHTRKYFEWYVAKKPSGQPYKRDHKNRSLSFTYSKLGIPKELIRSEHARGIYFSPLYDNTYDFLCGKCDGNDLKKSFETSTESLSNTWKEKHARGRIGFLKKKNKVSTETLFYDDLIYLSWQETKDKYLSQVGR